MRRSAGWLAIAFLVVVGVAPAASQPGSDIEVRIERDTRPRPGINELQVHHLVTITERATNRPSEKRYDVFGMATNQQGEETAAFTCSHVADDEPTAPPNLYLCTVFVDHGGVWDFVAVVNQVRSDPDQVPVTVGRASVPFELATSQVYTGRNPDEEPTSASAGDVALLWGHVLIAGAWFLCVGALSGLALPALRRRLSSLTINRLEWRFDFLVKLTFGITAGVIATGTYLLLNQTAYATPFSSSEIEDVFNLPYGKPYFLTLAAKVGFYGLMVVAVFPLVSGARRQLRLGFGMAESGATGTALRGIVRPGGDTAPVTTLVEAPPEVKPAPREEPPASVGVLLAALMVLFGLLVISLCVTLLKYFHQLVEASQVGL